jgi:hypothetical protein
LKSKQMKKRIMGKGKQEEKRKEGRREGRG